jgi:predicted small secreted protein
MLRFIALAFVIASFGLTGCNTIEGMGEDIETAGQEIEQEAQEFN